MAELRAIKTRKQRCDEDVVEKLEYLLREARAGEIVAIGVAAVYRDKSIGTTFGKNMDAGRLLGAVTRLSHRISSALDAE